MRVLFVTSLKTTNFNVSPFIQSQADSLKRKGIEIDYFYVNLNGISAILNSISRLRSCKNNYDLIHAHYSTNALIAVLAGIRSKLVISYLGSDLLGINKPDGTKRKISYLITLISYFVSFFAKAIIVKSEEMKQKISSNLYNKTQVIPNGVDFDKFSPSSQSQAKKDLGLNNDEKHILFLGNTNDANKNYQLTKQAFDLLPKDNFTLVAPYPTEPQNIPIYLNAADVLVLTSISEGSANVIKEALACNTPIITVNAGDASENIKYVSKSILVDYNSNIISKKIEELCQDNNRSNGRSLINHLEISNIADRIISLYNTIYNV